MSVKNRLKEFIKSQKWTISSFEKGINVSNGYVNSISKGIGGEVLMAILEKSPNLNINWLLTGQGSMLKQGSQASSSQPQENNNEIISLLRDKISLLEKNNALQEKEIHRLETHNQHLTHRLSVLEAATHPDLIKNIAG